MSFWVVGSRTPLVERDTQYYVIDERRRQESNGKLNKVIFVWRQKNMEKNGTRQLVPPHRCQTEEVDAIVCLNTRIMISYITSEKNENAVVNVLVGCAV